MSSPHILTPRATLPPGWLAQDRHQLSGGNVSQPSVTGMASRRDDAGPLTYMEAWAMAGNRNDRAYVAKREALKRQAQRTAAPCWLCLKPFDFALDYKHPMAFTADHVEAIANGGSMTGALRPAHRSCNSRRGKGRDVLVISPVDPGEEW